MKLDKKLISNWGENTTNYTTWAVSCYFCQTNHFIRGFSLPSENNTKRSLKATINMQKNIEDWLFENK